MRLKITYGLLALVIVASAVSGWAAFATKNAMTKTVTVTNTRTVVRKQTFDGTANGLVAMLHPQGAQQVKCPTNYKTGVACYILAGGNWIVQAAFAPQGTAR